MVDISNLDRRSLLKGVGVAGIAGLAGCTGNGDGNGNGNGNGDGNGDGNGNGDAGEAIGWHAGGTGGTYYPFSQELKDIVETETNHTLQVQSTGASVENVGSLASGDADFALIQNDIATFATEGRGISAFEGNPIDNLRGVATLYPETIHILTRPDAGIETVADLEGMRVNTGDSGSGTQVNALQILESAAGLTPDDFDEQNSEFAQAADQIRDGDVDAAFIVGGWPVGAIEELATTADVDLLELSDDERATLQEDAQWFTDDTVPGGTYPDIDEDTDTVSVQAMIATREEYNEDIVEEVTAAIFDNEDQITIQSEFVSRDTAQDGMPIDLHPGAAAYFN